MESPLTDADLDKAFVFAKDLARQSGEIITKYFQSADMAKNWKEDNSIVTVADTTINQLVISKIQESYPEHGVYGEEDTYEIEREWLWVVDPLDGTSPFSLGIPISTFALALVHNGDVIFSIVFDPFQDRMFVARKGQGAFVNDAKLEVSKEDTFKRQFVLSFRSLTKPDHKGVNIMFDELQRQGAKIYMFAGFSYGGALVAEGRFVAACMAYGSPWDAAAISLIVQEAGGKATDMNGKPRKYNVWGDGLIVSNGLVHDRLVKLIDYENTRD